MKIKSLLICVILSVGLIFVCTACGDNGGNSTDLSSSSMPDFQYMFKLLGAQMPTQKSDSGYYNVVNNHIVYTDSKNLKSTPLCNKSDCLHTADYPECNALINTGTACIDNFQIYKGNIYYLSEQLDSNNNEQISKLNCLSLDGSEKNIALSLKNKFILDWFIYDGYFYYQPTISIGSDSSTSVSGNLYRVNLSDKKDELFLDFSKISDIYGTEGSLRNVYDGYMYITLSGYADEKDYNNVVNGKISDQNISTIRKITRYSLADGACDFIDPYNNDYEFIGFQDGKLLGTDISDRIKKVCISDLDGKNPKTIIELDSQHQVFCDDNYIYEYNQSLVNNDDGAKSITVYDKQGDKISTAYISDEIADSINSITFYDDYLWFQKTDDTAKTSLCCVKKSDLLKNETKVTYQEVYSYE